MKTEPKTEKNDANDVRDMIQDQFVFLIWSNLVFAKLFFARFLPFQLLNLIDLDTLELVSTRITGRDGSDSFGDIFYRFRFKSGRRGVLTLLIEHKSYYDRLVSFQILRYEAGVLKQMENEPEKFVDDDGRFPIPYSILLCQKPCPQFDDVAVRCEGLDYGIRTRFQEICFDKIDVDSLLDEPLLHVALGLARFAGYKDKEKERRQGELLTLFRSLTNLDPMKRENLKETWQFILEVSFNYLSKLTRNITFDVNQFKRELFNIKGDEMQSQIYDDVFEWFFSDKVQPYKDAVAVAQAEMAEEKTLRRDAEAKSRDAEAKSRDAEAKSRDAEAKSRELEAKNQRLEAQVKDVTESYYSTMYRTIRNTLCKSGKVENVPNDVLNKIEDIRSSSVLGELLSVAASPQDNYATFLKTLNKGVALQ